MSLLFALVAAFGLFLLTATLVLLVIGPTILLQPRRRTEAFYRALGQPIRPSDIGLEFEDFSLRARDGTLLRGWLVRSKPRARGTLLYLHGVADCKIDGIRFARLMHDHRFNVVLFDSRRHGASGGKYCTYGYYEKHDLVEIIDHLDQHGDLTPGTVGIFGTSMGASIALQAAAIDRRIGAVAAENSFATLRSIFDDYQKRMVYLPFHYLRNVVIKRSERMAHFKANDVSPLEAVRSIHIPVLIIYGTEDAKIRHEYSLQLYESANEPKGLFPVKDAAHTNAWDIAGKAYEDKLVDFFTRSLS